VCACVRACVRLVSARECVHALMHMLFEKEMAGAYARLPAPASLPVANPGSDRLSRWGVPLLAGGSVLPAGCAHVHMCMCMC